MTDEIYLDKIKLGAVIISKQFELIESYNKLVHFFKVNPNVVKDYTKLEQYWVTWKILNELYDTLKKDYLEKIPKKDQDVIKKIADNYSDILQVSILNLNDLKVSYNIVLDICAKSKFFDILRKSEGGGLIKIRNKFKLDK